MADRAARIIQKNRGRMMKRGEKYVYITLAALLAAVITLALLNRGDSELRRALGEMREFLLLVNGEHAATVDLQALLDLTPHGFTTTMSTSIATPREVSLRGVELRLLLEAYGVDISEASHVTVTGLDGYRSPLSVSEVNAEETIYICFEMDGEILKPQDEGGYGPYMMAIRGSRFAQRWCKYVESVDVAG